MDIELQNRPISSNEPPPPYDIISGTRISPSSSATIPINQHRRLRLSITPPPPYPESSNTTPESLSEVCTGNLIPTLRIEPPPYKPKNSSVTPPPPYPSSSSGSQDSCHIDDVRTPSEHCLSPYQSTSHLQVRRDERARLSLPEATVRRAVDILSPSQPPPSPHALTVRTANSNPTLMISSNRRLTSSSQSINSRPQRVHSAVIDPNIISVIAPEFTSERSLTGQDCPQCGLNSNNIIWYNARRNSNQCDTQGERMCTIITIGLAACFIMIIPSSMIGMGAAHLDYCPAYDNIPIYLIVAGVFGVLKVLIYSVQVSIRFSRSRLRTDNSTECSADSGAKFNPIDCAFNCFLLAIILAGSVIIYRANKKTSNNPGDMNYCDAMFYRYAFMIHTTCLPFCILGFTIYTVGFASSPKRSSNDNGCLNSTFKLLIGTKQTGSTMAARNLRRLHNISHYDRTKLHQTYYWYPWYRSR